jgi:hypothetical protein
MHSWSQGREELGRRLQHLAARGGSNRTGASRSGRLSSSPQGKYGV